MSDPSTRPSKVVAVINSNEDTVQLLRQCLEMNGFRQVVTAHVRDIREGATDFLEFVSRTQPAVFVYDISIPYDGTGGSCSCCSTPRSCRAGAWC